MSFKSLFGFGPSVNLKEVYDNNALVVDVRTPMEFEEGHFDPSLNIPLSELNQNIEDLKKYDKPVILICRSGVRAAQAKGFLNRAGIEAHNGGGWIEFRAIVS